MDNRRSLIIPRTNVPLSELQYGALRGGLLNDKRAVCGGAIKKKITKVKKKKEKGNPCATGQTTKKTGCDANEKWARSIVRRRARNKGVPNKDMTGKPCVRNKTKTWNNCEINEYVSKAKPKKEKKKKEKATTNPWHKFVAKYKKNNPNWKFKFQTGQKLNKYLGNQYRKGSKALGHAGITFKGKKTSLKKQKARDARVAKISKARKKARLLLQKGKGLRGAGGSGSGRKKKIGAKNEPKVGIGERAQAYAYAKELAQELFGDVEVNKLKKDWKSKGKDAGYWNKHIDTYLDYKSQLDAGKFDKELEKDIKKDLGVRTTQEQLDNTLGRIKKNVEKRKAKKGKKQTRKFMKDLKLDILDQDQEELAKTASNLNNKELDELIASWDDEFEESERKRKAPKKKPKLTKKAKKEIDEVIKEFDDMQKPEPKPKPAVAYLDKETAYDISPLDDIKNWWGEATRPIQWDKPTKKSKKSKKEKSSFDKLSQFLSPTIETISDEGIEYLINQIPKYFQEGKMTNDEIKERLIETRIKKVITKKPKKNQAPRAPPVALPEPPSFDKLLNQDSKMLRRLLMTDGFTKRQRDEMKGLILKRQLKESANMKRLTANPVKQPKGIVHNIDEDVRYSAPRFSKEYYERKIKRGASTKPFGGRLIKRKKKKKGK